MANAAKAYFAMQKGLNTEAPLISFPDGYTTEEQNYELTVRGERRRRLGLGLEDGGINLDIPEYAQGDAVRVFDWENVAGIPTINMEVMQVGYTLYLFDDSSPTSTTRRSVSIDLRPYKTTNASFEQVSTWPLEAHFGRGHLFLFGKYTDPVFIEYDPNTDNFAVSQINIRERDFEGIEDGYSNSTQPVVPLASHTYNLKNRGWTQELIDAYYTDQSLQPSKAMIPWLGLRRALTAANAYDDDGIRSFDPAKLAAEYFQDASAPSGHFIKNPFDTTTSPEESGSLPIASWDVSSTVPGATVTMTINTSGDHGLIVGDDITLVNLVAVILSYIGDEGEPYTNQWVLDNYAAEVLTVPDTDTFTISVTFPSFAFLAWWEQYAQLGSVYGADVPNGSGAVTDFRPKAGAFFAGRAWYAGIDTARLTGRIYFSQVIENDSQYAKCYQVADPTDERISDLVASDGGVIVIPEAANVLKLLPHNSSLLIFASNGVWEIGPGDLGYFAATSYSVRKVSDSGAVSPGSVILLDNVPVYWGVTDVLALVPNEQNGFLQTQNLSEQVINTFYNSIPLEKRRQVVGVYDDLSKRLIWLYASDSAINSQAYDRALVYDARMQAWIPFAFAYESTAYLVDIFILKEAEAVSKVKYVAVIDGELVIGEANNYTDYMDFGIEEPECYMVTGFDSLRDPAAFKLAPTVWVFSRKTEEGYTGDTLEPIRPSSTLMRSRWEWADNASASRWGREQEVYRHSRTYVPEDASDTFDDGVPVVVTKNKLRGKGRVLQLEFRAGEGKDSFISGWKTNFTRLQNG
jgi:hypothetical protein